MATFRVEKNKDYTVMSNYHLRDTSISLKAKGLLSQMLSLPEEWDYTLAGLAHINKESVDAIRSAVKELEKARYIRRQRTRTETGVFTGIEYVIYEQPIRDTPTLDEPVLGEPTLDEPMLDEPILENPTLENPTLDEPMLDEPILENPTLENPTLDEPTLGKPALEEPTLENPMQLNKDISNKDGDSQEMGWLSVK